MHRQAFTMSEPVSTGAGGWALIKFLPPVIGPVLATIVVMAMSTPQSRGEWIAALTSTVTLSIFGGSFLVSYFGWNSWAEDLYGLTAITGLCFVCGLPAWLLVRGLFAWMNKQNGKDILELARAVAAEVKNIGR